MSLRFRSMFLVFVLFTLSFTATAQITKSNKQPANSTSQTSTVKPTNNANNSSAPIQVYFGPKAADDPSSVLYNLLRFIDSAKTSIYGSAHEVDLVVIAQKLAERAEAGVDVQLVVEARWLSLPKDSAAVDILKKSKVRLYPDTKKSGLMHNKFFIADKQRVWTGSTNLTEHCMLFNYNNGVWIDNDRVAQNFLTEFYEERAGKFGRKGSGPPNTPYPVVNIGTARVATFFSPEDQPLPQIVAMIDRAKKTVDVLCFVFSSKEIAEALIAAHKRGVVVRVLLDNSFSSAGNTARWRYIPFKELGKAGISCKYDDVPAKIHHKLVIVDGQEVMTGSFNLSNNAAKSNDENLLIINSGEIGNKYQAEFDRLWNFFSGDPGEAPEPDDEDRINSPATKSLDKETDGSSKESSDDDDSDGDDEDGDSDKDLKGNKEDVKNPPQKK